MLQGSFNHASRLDYRNNVDFCGQFLPSLFNCAHLTSLSTTASTAALETVGGFVHKVLDEIAALCWSDILVAIIAVVWNLV